MYSNCQGCKKHQILVFVQKRHCGVMRDRMRGDTGNAKDVNQNTCCLQTTPCSWRYPSNETGTEPLCLGRLYLRRRNGGCTMITMAKLLRLMLVLTVMMRLIKKGRQTREKGTSNGSISWWVGWTQQIRSEILTGLIRCIRKLVGVVEWPWKWPTFKT